MPLEYYSILTNKGEQKQLECLTSPQDFDLYEIAVGDSNGVYYEPVKAQTALKNEKWRGLVSEFSQKDNKTYCIVHIPAAVGGFTIREVGVYDSLGNLIVIGKCPETLKQSADTGTIKQLVIEVDISMINSTILSVLADPSIITASTAYVNNHVSTELANYQKLEEKGQPNGYAPLNLNNLIPEEYLPENLPLLSMNSGNINSNGASDILFAPGTGTAWDAWSQPVLSSLNDFGTITPAASEINTINIFNGAGTWLGNGPYEIYWEFPVPMVLQNVLISAASNPYKWRGSGSIDIYDAVNNILLGTFSYNQSDITYNLPISEVLKIKIIIRPDPLSGADARWIKSIKFSGQKKVTVSTATTLFFKAGGIYPNLKTTFNYLETIDFQNLLSVDMSAYANGKYNIFIKKDGALAVLSNTIYIQPITPTSPVINDIWLNTSIAPNKQLKYSGTTWEDFDAVHLGSVVVTNGFITSVKTEPFNTKTVTIPNNIRPAYVIETYKNGASWYRKWSDGFIEQGGTANVSNTSVQLIIPFTNTNYNVQANPSGTQTNQSSVAYHGTKTLTSFNLILYLSISGVYAGSVDWEAKGF